PDLSPCDYFFFSISSKLKKQLAGRRYRTRQALASAVYQCMLGIPENEYEDAFKNWIKRLKLCVRNKGNYFEGLTRE
ncbi:MAG: hypothetical protein AB2693_15955, partial [Candidatus Thiodiazotropha sp.]